jgi:ubiquitin carboxyl-terminal hydrolase 36/42
MLISQSSNSQDQNNVKIRFNSNLSKQNSFKGNNNQTNGFDYQVSLLNKKRKLENDLKNGNINNFNRILNNAVLNSIRNNDSELIPNKIEFKLTHILKGDKKIPENTINSGDFNNGNNSLIDTNKKKINESNDEKITNGNGLYKNEYNKNTGNNLKNTDSDNNSDLTKTSSVEDTKKFLKTIDNIFDKPATLNNQNNNKISNISNCNDFYLLGKNSIKSNNNELIKLNSRSYINNINNDENLVNKPPSRKNSCLSNSSDKQKSNKNQVFHDNYIDSLLEWRRPSHIGSGLNNMGNTCFLNSVLQSLLYTPSLINYFIFSEHKKKCNPKGICLLCEFHCLIDLSKANKIVSLTPKNILNNLKFISKNIKIGRQEDAHEFLLYLLDGLEKACKNYITSIKNNFIVSSNLNDDNLIQKLFGGKMASCVICLKCKNVSKKIDQYLDISIVINLFISLLNII